MGYVPRAVHLVADLSYISDEPNRLTRLGYGPAETEAFDLVRRVALGTERLSVHTDVAGNLVVSLIGYQEGAEVWCGSHLDTVPNGGRFDGVVGVAGGLEALARLAQGPRLERTVRLAVLRCEESAAFGACYLGSKAMLGALDLDADLARARPDACHGDQPRALREWIGACGGSPEALGNALIDPARLRAFVELHIEQGDVLRHAHRPLGVVTAIRGNLRYPEVVVRGVAAHSGTTPMNDRVDAFVAASMLAHNLRSRCLRLQRDAGGPTFTVGKFYTGPGDHAISKVPDRVTMALEFRSGDRDEIVEFRRHVVNELVVIERATGVTAAATHDPVVTDPVSLDLTDEIEDVVRARYPAGGGDPLWMRLESGAGHDAAVFAEAGVPTGMIFVRNSHGSHNPREFAAPDDIETGVDCLTEVLRHFASR